MTSSDSGLHFSNIGVLMGCVAYVVLIAIIIFAI